MNKINFPALFTAVACLLLLTVDMSYAALAKLDDGKTWTAHHGDTVSVWASGGPSYPITDEKNFGIVALNSDPGGIKTLINENTSSFSFKIRKGEGENASWYADLYPFNGSATPPLQLNSAQDDTAKFGFYFSTKGSGIVTSYVVDHVAPREHYYAIEERQNPSKIFDLEVDSMKISASSTVPVPSAGLLLFSGTLLIGISRKRGRA